MDHTLPSTRNRIGSASHRTAEIVSAGLICLFVLGLFYYWFEIANRYVVFLYNHLGEGPFDPMTTGRYWMSGLVASGAVMVVYVGANGVLGGAARLRHGEFRPPAWPTVWALCAVPLAASVLWITMTRNWPTLPLGYALTCVASTPLGLAFALWPGSMAARRPLDLGWLVLDGLGLMPCLLLLHAVELPARGLVSVPMAWLVAAGSLVAGVLWLGWVTVLRAWRHKTVPGAGSLLAMGLCLSYLLMPLLHYFIADPQYHYITASSNYFAFDFLVQVMVCLAAAALALGATRVRAGVNVIPA